MEVTQEGPVPLLPTPRVTPRQLASWDREQALQGRQVEADREATSFRAHDEVSAWGAFMERRFSEHLVTKRHVKYCDQAVLNYNMDGILGLGAWLAATSRASVFAKWGLLRDVFITIAISATICAILLLKKSTTAPYKEDVQQISRDLHTIVSFLMGFFVNVCFSRWWAIRNDGIGGLWGAADDLSMLIGAFFPSRSPADQDIRSRVTRWNVLSHELVYKQARAEDSLQDLVDCGVLLPEERECLEQLPSKPQVVWAWQVSFMTHLAYGDAAQNGGRLPYPGWILPQLLNLCTKARGSIGLMFAYTDTQVPFRYVQFLCLLIWVHNLLQAVTSAVVIANYVDSNGTDANVAIECFFLFLYPTIFLGLLQVGASMLNPLRASEDVDFPHGAFSYYMMAESRSFSSAASSPPFGRAAVWRPASPASERIEGSQPTLAWVRELEVLGKLRRDGLIDDEALKLAHRKLLST